MTPVPSLLGVRVGSLFTLYAWRLRQRLAQELLAAGGIAIGVALVFGVLLANTSITGSAASLVHQLVGSARLQLAARSPNGFDEHLAETAGRLPGVQVTAPVLRENVTIVGPAGRRQVQLIGVTPRLAALSSAVTQNLGPAGALLISGGVGLPSSVAGAIGAHATRSVTLIAGGVPHTLKVRAVLGSQTIGAVASSPVVIALLPVAQLLTGEPNRVTNVLIKTRPGAEAQVAGELRGLAAGRIDVEPADNELRLLSQAAQPNAQSTTLFAAISAMIGFLLALNAMLLTVPDRRRFIAELRTQGFAPGQVVFVLGFQALALGAVGSFVGILCGEVLSHTLFGAVPNYLTTAFAIGSQRIVTTATLLIPVACGMLAALLASLPPLLDLRSDRALDAVLFESGEAGQSISARTVRILGFAGAGLVIAVTLGALLAPSVTVLGGAILALAAVCVIPAAFAAILSLLAPLAERIRGSMLSVAIVELRASATRSIALAAVATLAVYGSVAIGGARSDLIHGLETAIAEYEGTADIWVTAGQSVFNTDSFKISAAQQQALAHAPGIAAVRSYQGALLDVGSRRLLIRARDPRDSSMIQPSQLLHGNLALANRLIRGGGWASISDGFAREHHLDVGNTFVLPTPSGGLRLGVAAITTNLGWPPGTIALSLADYRRGWESNAPAALEIELARSSGVSPAQGGQGGVGQSGVGQGGVGSAQAQGDVSTEGGLASHAREGDGSGVAGQGGVGSAQSGLTLAQGKRVVQAALGSHTGLQTQTFREREAQTDSNARQALQSLDQIAMLLLFAGAVAVAASLSAVIWQRRARLAAMKNQGFDQWQLWRSLILESTIVLGIGSLVGAVFGVYGHALADRWLRLTTGFPAPFSPGWPQVFLTFALLAGIALAVVALPGLSAARAPSRTGFQE
jgi:putative ABC transport system permease protein